MNYQNVQKKCLVHRHFNAVVSESSNNGLGKISAFPLRSMNNVDVFASNNDARKFADFDDAIG